MSCSDLDRFLEACQRPHRSVVTNDSLLTTSVLLDRSSYTVVVRMAAPEASAVRQRSPSPDDALEFFADSLEALYDHHVPAHGDPLQLYTYTPPTATGVEPITVRLPPQAVNSLFAHHVWNAALRMADALTERRLVVEGGAVLELGAGAGIPGLVAARMGAERVRPACPRVPSLLAELFEFSASADPVSYCAGRAFRL